MMMFLINQLVILSENSQKQITGFQSWHWWLADIHTDSLSLKTLVSFWEALNIKYIKKNTNISLIIKITEQTEWSIHWLFLVKAVEVKLIHL